jgi:predicted AAA+ superfamily ATPase
MCEINTNLEGFGTFFETIVLGNTRRFVKKKKNNEVLLWALKINGLNFRN